MNTPSHILLHLGLKKYFKNSRNIHIPKSFVFGAFAPDIGLYLCAIFYSLYSLYFLDISASETARYMFDILYFENAIWIFAYNILHAPLMLLVFFIIAKIFQNYLGQYYTILKWFLLGCLLHTLIDIPLHHDDGPRIFYPLSDYIFLSPLSYWDTNHFAKYIIPAELLLCIFSIFYLFIFPRFSHSLGKK